MPTTLGYIRVAQVGKNVLIFPPILFQFSLLTLYAWRILGVNAQCTDLAGL